MPSKVWRNVEKICVAQRQFFKAMFEYFITPLEIDEWYEYTVFVKKDSQGNLRFTNEQLTKYSEVKT